MNSNLSTLKREREIIDSISITYDLNRFGPRQRNAFDRYVKRGVVAGVGAPALIALRYLDARKLPHIHLGNYGWTQMRHVPLGHPIRNALANMMVIWKMEQENNKESRSNSNSAAPITLYDERFDEAMKTSTPYFFYTPRKLAVRLLKPVPSINEVPKDSILTVTLL